MPSAPAPTERTAEAQLALWIEGVDLLGGQAAVARVLGCEEALVAALCAGTSALYEEQLRAVSQALLRHADRCRKLERQLSPDFSGNLTRSQARPPHTRPQLASKT